MINKKISTIPSFVSHAQVLIPIMQRGISRNSNKKMAIYKSLSAQKPLFVPVEKIDANGITLEDFLVMLDDRMKSEFAYQEEIMQLRSNLSKEFNNLCVGVADKNFIEFIKGQTQKIVDAIIHGTKVEQKVIIEKFFHHLISGVEKEFDLKEFKDVINAVLWKPLLTPFPIDAQNKLKEIIKGLGSERSVLNIEKMTNQYVEYIKTNMESKEIKDSSFKKVEEFTAELENLAKNRKICTIIINDMTKNESIIDKFRGICIENIKIQISSKNFLSKQIKTYYNELDLSGKIEEKNFEKLFDQIPKSVKSLKIELGKGKYISLKKHLSNLLFLENLNLIIYNNDIGKEGAITISAALRELTKISILALDLTSNQIGVEGAKAVSAALSELKNISTLSLKLQENGIGVEGAKAVATALSELKNISTLSLNLQTSRIKMEGAVALSIALKKLTNISVLDLQLWNNNIEVEGIKALSAALGELKCISNLTLNFMLNNIGVEGAKSLSSALKNLKNISNLNLEFGDNNIGGEGAKALSIALKELTNISTLTLHSIDEIGAEGVNALLAALKELKNISTLKLHFVGYNFGVEGAKILSIALRELKNMSTLNLNLGDNNILVAGAVALSIALKELKNLSTLDLNLDGNNIQDEGAIAISGALKNLNRFVSLKLHLNNNIIEEKGAKTMLTILKELKNISYMNLRLGDNEIGDAAARAALQKIIPERSNITIFLVHSRDYRREDESN